MEAIALNTIQSEILIRLAKYKFLTLSQLLKLDCGTTQYKYLWKKIQHLTQRRRPLVSRVQFNTIDRVGRVEDLYYLTKLGAASLTSSNDDEIEHLYPKGNVVSAKDYFHRKTTIDFQIAIDDWISERGYQQSFFYRYFDKIGNRRVSNDLSSLSLVKSSQGKNIIADSLFILEDKGFKRLFVFELHNGKDSKRIFDQIIAHLQALVSGSVHKQYNYPPKRAYFILILFEKQSTLESLISRVEKEREKFAPVHHLVLCKSIECFQTHSMDEEWTSILGESHSLIIKHS